VLAWSRRRRRGIDRCPFSAALRGVSPLPPTLVGVSIPEDPADDGRDGLEGALAATVANAAAGGVVIGPDEQALIRLHQTGGIDDGEFLVRLRQVADRPRTLDLAHLLDLHERLFEQVYPFAGQLRYVDVAKPGQAGEPFLHHRWIETYLGAVAEQLRALENLTGLPDPGEWADRAGYFWAALHHAHPFREGNGRSIRLWVEDLAAAAGHRVGWRGVSPERQVNVVAAAAHGDHEPTRALLTVAVGGRVGVDRPVAALDDLYRLQHRQAWAAVGLRFGTDSDRDTITHDLREVEALLGAVCQHLDTRTGRAVCTEQPAAERWRGLAASVHPGLARRPGLAEVRRRPGPGGGRRGGCRGGTASAGGSGPAAGPCRSRRTWTATRGRRCTRRGV
jgi:cell filamentation protein